MPEPDPTQQQRFRQLYLLAIVVGALGLVMVMIGWLVPGVALLLSMVAFAIGAELAVRS